MSYQHLYELLEAGKPVEAMELYYHDEVVMQENEEKPRIGKAFCLQYEKGLMAQVQDFEAKVLAQAVNEETGIVFTEMEIGFTSAVPNCGAVSWSGGEPLPLSPYSFLGQWQRRSLF